MDKQTISPETLKIEFLTPETCVFGKTAGSFLKADICGETYPRVFLARALPLSQPENYICITDTEKKELGIILDIHAFPADQQAMIRAELDICYYCPVIESIDSIKEKMGQFYFDVHIGGKKKSFTVKDISKSIRMNGADVDITDIDANRYRITDFSAIPTKSRRKLEPYIY